MSFLVSIIMPAYNAEQFILKAIESVIAQTYRNWELIVVDDGSTDNTGDIIRSFSRKDSRIKYYHQTNQKQAAARNLGISKTKGEWIGFIDADDLWVVEKLEVQYKHIQIIDSDVFFSNGYIIDETDNIIADYPGKPGKFTAEKMYKILYQRNSIPMLSVLVKKQWVEIVGPQDENEFIAQSCEDYDYWLRLSLLGATFYGIEKKLFKYRVHLNATSTNTSKMDLGQALVLIKNFNKKNFTKKEIRTIFKPFADTLLIDIMRSNKYKESSILLKSLFSKIPIFSYKLYYFLFKILNKYSFYPIKVVNKIDTMIHGK